MIPILTPFRSEKTPQPSDSKFGWIKNYRGLNDDHILMHSSLDNYLFLRLFKILFTICFVGALITWPILFPVNATGKLVAISARFMSKLTCAQVVLETSNSMSCHSATLPSLDTPTTTMRTQLSPGFLLVSYTD